MITAIQSTQPNKFSKPQTQQRRQDNTFGALFTKTIPARYPVGTFLRDVLETVHNLRRYLNQERSRSAETTFLNNLLEKTAPKKALLSNKHQQPYMYRWTEKDGVHVFVNHTETSTLRWHPKSKAVEEITPKGTKKNLHQVSARAGGDDTSDKKRDVIIGRLRSLLPKS